MLKQILEALQDWNEGNDTAVYVQDQLRRVGVRMEISGYPGVDAIWERVKAGEFEAANAPFYLYQLEERLHGAGYYNAAFFQKLAELRSTFDPEKRERLHREMTPVFQAGPPATLLFPYVPYSIASTRIRGLDQSPYREAPTRCMDELWLEEQA